MYTTLNAELQRLRPAACVSCRMPLPFCVERPEPASANWRIGTPSPCAHGCDAIISQIAAQLRPLYDLRDPCAVPVKDPMTPQR